MIYVEKGSEDEFERMSPKQKRRWALKQFHTDVAGSHENSTSTHPTVDIVLGTLTKSDSLESWPESYSDLEENPKFTISGPDSEENRTFYLPSTPEEFIYSLWGFKKDGSKEGFLNEAPKHFIVEGGRAAFEVDTSIAKIRDSIRSATDLHSLTRLYDAVDILSTYSPEELLGHADRSNENMLTLINEQALKIMRVMADMQKLTGEIVEEFPFYRFKSVSDDSSELEWDSGVRAIARSLILLKKTSALESAVLDIKDVTRRIRNASTVQGLDDIEKSLKEDARYRDLKQMNLLRALARMKRRNLTK